MKNHVRSLAVITGLSALLGSSMLLAQADAQETATVPFAFQASGKTLPAGKYRVGVAVSSGVIQIVDAHTGHSILVLGRGRDFSKDATPRLTFHRYGSEYFLAEVWMPGVRDGYSLGKSAREKEMAKQSGPITLASIRLAGN